MVHKPQVSIVIPCHNEQKRLTANSQSILAQVTDFSFELIYVENNSRDGTWKELQRLAKKYPNKIRICREAKPGAPAARNTGVREAKGKIIIFTDADCEFVPNWLQDMAAPFLLPQRELLPMGYVSGQVISRLPEQRKMNIWEQYFDRLFFVTELERIDSNLLPWAPSCNLAFRRDIFLAMGGLDEIWTSAYDTDLSWRILFSGFACQYAWGAVAYHERRATLPGLLKQWENYAAYNFSMFREYRRQKRNPWRRKMDDALENFKELVPGMMRYTGVGDGLASLPLDLVVKGNVFRGALRSLRSDIVPNAKFRISRRGELASIRKMLPGPYRELHLAGWCYWINPRAYPLGSELLLKNMDSGKKLYLNDTTWSVWEAASQGVPAKLIVKQLQDKYGVIPQISRDVQRAIDWLKNEKLLS